MITATVRMESFTEMPPKDGQARTFWLAVVDVDAIERIGFAVSDPTHIQRLATIAKDTDFALAIALRPRRAGGYTPRVLDVGLPKESK